MVTEKTESTIIVKCARSLTKSFTAWLVKEAKVNKLSVTYTVTGTWFSGNKIQIVSVGEDEDIDKFERYIENKLSII